MLGFFHRFQKKTSFPVHKRRFSCDMFTGNTTASIFQIRLDSSLALVASKTQKNAPSAFLMHFLSLVTVKKKKCSKKLITCILPQYTKHAQKCCCPVWKALKDMCAFRQNCANSRCPFKPMFPSPSKTHNVQGLIAVAYGIVYSLRCKGGNTLITFFPI